MMLVLLQFIFEYLQLHGNISAQQTSKKNIRLSILKTNKMSQEINPAFHAKLMHSTWQFNKPREIAYYRALLCPILSHNP